MSRRSNSARRSSLGAASRSKPSWVLAALCLGGCVAAGCSDTGLQPYVLGPARIDVHVESYCPLPGYRATSLFVTNNSLWLGSDGTLWIDYDRDGLSDDFETLAKHADQFGIDAGDPDTLKDGYGDLVVSVLGMVKEDQRELPHCQQHYQDLDRDGLDDCEEALVGTDEYSPDTDEDGIPDGIEVRHGFNPLDIEDAHLDPDQDGLSVADEIRRNTPPHLHNDDMLDFREISYDIVDLVRADGTMCQQIDIKSIPIDAVDNGNFVRLWFLETGFAPAHGALSELRTVTLIVSQIVSDGTVLRVKDVRNQFQTEGFPDEAQE